MIFTPEKYIQKDLKNVNEEMLAMKGELEEREAKLSLVKFLRSNIGFAGKLMTGIDVYPFQEIAIKMMFERTFTLNVWGRSVSKSFTARMFAILYLLMEPGSKIILAGPTFRTSRLMFEEIHKIVTSRGASRIHDMFREDNLSRRNEMYKWVLPNGSELMAIPLSGDKIRGLRANILILDEYLLLPEKIITTVLMPFILSPQDLAEIKKTRDTEDEMIERGELKEEDRTKFKNKSKMIGLSSASYTFENLYRTYCDWIEKCKNSEVGGPTYFVSRLGYEAVPESMLDKNVIREAKSDESEAYFKREYEAQFIDDSCNYFSAKKMSALTIASGEAPTLKLWGDKEKEYVLGIDPNFDESETSDFFAFCILEVNRKTRKHVLVHSFGGAGVSIGRNIEYLKFLMTNFNIVFIMIDRGGADQFLGACNVSQHFKSKNLKKIDFDTNKEGSSYGGEVKEAKKQYLMKDNSIIVSQHFSSKWLRKSNEYLQASIDHKRLWFGSPINGNDVSMTSFLSEKEGFDENLVYYVDPAIDSSCVTSSLKRIKMIDTQDRFMNETKAQCAQITVKSTLQGTQSFDLPTNLKSDRGKNRVRKDNYSALLLANWGVKCFLDLDEFEGETRKVDTFEPIFIY